LYIDETKIKITNYIEKHWGRPCNICTLCIHIQVWTIGMGMLN